VAKLSLVTNEKFKLDSYSLKNKFLDLRLLVLPLEIDQGFGEKGIKNIFATRWFFMPNEQANKKYLGKDFSR